MADTRIERERVLKYWTDGQSEDEIAGIMGLGTKKVHNYIDANTVSLSAMTNEQILAKEMWARGKTEDEIAGILDIDVRQVRAFLERG